VKVHAGGKEDEGAEQGTERARDMVSPPSDVPAPHAAMPFPSTASAHSSSTFYRPSADLSAQGSRHGAHVCSVVSRDQSILTTR
jgi:hypothetical protein